MSAGLVVMLLGIFVVPLILLWAGHRMRRRSDKWQLAFWGAAIGHIAAIVIGSTAGMIPPEEWSPTDTWRGALAFWSFLVLPAAGALIGWVKGRPE